MAKKASERSTSAPRRRATTQAAAPAKKRAKADGEDTKKAGLSATFQSLLIRYPMAMGILQSGVFAAAGSVVAQLCFTDEPFTLNKVYTQMFISMVCIAPVVALWFRFLFSLNLHWVKATLIDQFMFSPIFNSYIFFFISATLGGGVRVALPDLSADVLNLTVSIDTTVFPSLLSFEPVWRTQLIAYPIWLPATLLREKVVPPHLAQLFTNAVAFVWNIIFALIIG